MKRKFIIVFCFLGAILFLCYLIFFANNNDSNNLKSNNMDISINEYFRVYQVVNDIKYHEDDIIEDCFKLSNSEKDIYENEMIEIKDIQKLVLNENINIYNTTLYVENLVADNLYEEEILILIDEKTTAFKLYSRGYLDENNVRLSDCKEYFKDNINIENNGTNNILLYKQSSEYVSNAMFDKIRFLMLYSPEEAYSFIDKSKFKNYSEYKRIFRK